MKCELDDVLATKWFFSVTRTIIFFLLPLISPVEVVDVIYHTAYKYILFMDFCHLETLNSK